MNFLSLLSILSLVVISALTVDEMSRNFMELEMRFSSHLLKDINETDVRNLSVLADAVSSASAGDLQTAGVANSDFGFEKIEFLNQAIYGLIFVVKAGGLEKATVRDTTR